MNEQKISPAGLMRLKEALLQSESEGYGPDDCARFALDSVGLPHTPTKFVVDYSLDGPVFPFVGGELAASNKET
jgi:hypothetical protein